MRRARLAPMLLAVLVLSACGDDGEAVPAGDAPTSTTAPPDATRYRGTVTVLESPQHGPQLCSAVADSYPPQCQGPDVEGWDWDAVDDEESAAGTTWGRWTVTGTWDGEALTLTEPPAPPSPTDDEAGWAPDLSTPCPAPDGGWAPVDPATTTDEALAAALTYAEAQPGFAGAWVDQSINPASADPARGEGAMNDPTQLVLNVRFTDDLEAHRAALRQHWGGALCLSSAERTLEQLEAIAAEVLDAHDATSGGIDQVSGTVHVDVWVATGDEQAALDARYGEGVVRLHPVLRPL